MKMLPNFYIYNIFADFIHAILNNIFTEKNCFYLIYV